MIHLAMAALLQVAVPAAEPLSYKEAYEQAEQGKPLVVLVGAEWCPACVQMKKDSLPKVAEEGVLKQVAFTVVDTDKQGELAKEVMDEGGIPQLIMFHKNGDGWRRERLMGAQSPSAIVSFLRRGLQAAGRLVK